MSCIKEESQIFLTFIFLDVNASSTIMVRINWENLIISLIKVYFLVILIGVRLIEFTIKALV